MVLIMADKIAAISKPPTQGLNAAWARWINTVSGLSSGALAKYKLPAIPVANAPINANTIQLIAIRRDKRKSFALPMAIKRDKMCG